MRTRSEDFPRLVSVIEDDRIRALFTERFLVATEIFDEMVDAAAWRILDESGALPKQSGTLLSDTLERHPARTRAALRFLHRKLLDSRLLDRDGDTYRTTERRPGDVAALAAELRETVPEAAVGAEIVDLLVQEAPAFFRGEKSGEEILFSPIRLPLWFRYFSNDNLLYRINNTLGAEILGRVAPERAEILEVGGGCGSAAEAALRQLGAGVARYRFTELVPTFARRGERAARAAASSDTAVEAGKLDMTKPWADQGIAPASFDVVYSVNCFHVAPDLDAVLAEAKGALKPGGAVVVSECLRPTVLGRPIYVEFIFDFLESFTTVKTDPLKRPTHGFLTPEAWKASFAAAGFEDVTIWPDVDEIAKRFPDFFVGVVVAR